MGKTIERHPENMWLWEQVDELDAELETSDVEDATAWEKWDELENVLMVLAERAVWRESDDELADDEAYERMLDDISEAAELAEIAEESAESELAAFGNAEPWFYGEPELNVFGPDYSKGIWSEERQFTEDEEYDAWNAAIDDIPERFFELDWSM